MYINSVNNNEQHYDSPGLWAPFNPRHRMDIK